MQLEPIRFACSGQGLLVVVPAGLRRSWHRELAPGRSLPVTVNLPPDTEDGELVRRCRAGDERAFELLFRRHSAQVSGLVYRTLGPSPEQEDLVQEVFLQVVRSLGTFREEARFSTWLYRVAMNVVLMHLRAAARRPRLVEEEQGGPALDSAPSAHEAFETRQRVAAFYRLLARLSEKKRVVFVLHELEGLTPARIGEIVRAPVLTVRTRLFYARRELGRWLDEEPALAGALGELRAASAAPGSDGSGSGTSSDDERERGSS
jgi:RNA polymerase sigma-70 factor (ECF subfamily)